MRVIVLLAIQACMSLPAHAQFTRAPTYAEPKMVEGPAPPEMEHFVAWVSQGNSAQIPWKIATWGPRLSLDQRLELLIAITLRADRLRRLGAKQELVLLAGVALEGGDWLPQTGWLVYPIAEPLAGGTVMSITMPVLLKPGRYRIGIVLLDRVSGARSTTVEAVHAKRVRDDPLPELFDGLPSVEFLTTKDPHQRPERPHANQRRLVVRNKRPLHVEVITAMTLVRMHSKELAISEMMEMLDPLAAITLARGTLRFTGIDLDRGKLAFDLDFTKSRPWEKLRDALYELAPEVVEFETLANREKTEDFFRQFIEQRLHAEMLSPRNPGHFGGASNAQQDGGAPIRVLIIIGQDMDRRWNKEAIPVTPPEDCRCRVYFLRSERWGLRNNFGSVLKPLKPQVFKLENYRQVLATILEDLRSY